MQVQLGEAEPVVIARSDNTASFHAQTRQVQAALLCETGIGHRKTARGRRDEQVLGAPDRRIGAAELDGRTDRDVLLPRHARGHRATGEPLDSGREDVALRTDGW